MNYCTAAVAGDQIWLPFDHQSNDRSASRKGIQERGCFDNCIHFKLGSNGLFRLPIKPSHAKLLERMKLSASPEIGSAGELLIDAKSPSIKIPIHLNRDLDQVEFRSADPDWVTFSQGRIVVDAPGIARAMIANCKQLKLRDRNKRSSIPIKKKFQKGDLELHRYTSPFLIEDSKEYKKWLFWRPNAH